MATYVTTLPQNILPQYQATIRQVVDLLPLEIPYKINIWLAGKIVKYGITADSIYFVTDEVSFPDPIKIKYFSDLLMSLNIPTFLTPYWQDGQLSMLKLYENGVLIIDKDTLTYIKPPSPVTLPTVITVNELLKKLPKDILYTNTMYLTGSLVKEGWSANDIDIIIFDESYNLSESWKLKKLFYDILGWKVDIGRAIMPEREPVYLYKLYENGKICLPQSGV